MAGKTGKTINKAAKAVPILGAVLLAMLICIPVYAAETVSEVPGNTDISVYAKYVDNTNFTTISTDENGFFTFTTDGSAFYALCKDAKAIPGDKSPQTGDASNLALWIALLFISGGVITGVTVNSVSLGKQAKISILLYIILPSV